MRSYTNVLGWHSASCCKPVVVTLGHKGNWEWAGTSFSLLCRQPVYIVYHPLSNSILDKVMLQMRGRFGATSTTMDNVFKTLKKAGNEPILSAFVADQSPPPKRRSGLNFCTGKHHFSGDPKKSAADSAKTFCISPSVV